jgi:hypothetical protein
VHVNADYQDSHTRLGWAIPAKLCAPVLFCPKCCSPRIVEANVNTVQRKRACCSGNPVAFWSLLPVSPAAGDGRVEVA